MKSNLLFFDTFENSVKGFNRGAVILPIFLLLTYIGTYFTENYAVSFIKGFIFRFIIGIILVSAIGVQLPSSKTNAIVYSLLVGFVVFTITELSIINGIEDLKGRKSIMIVLWGMITTVVMGYSLYVIVENYPDSFAPILV
jgi:uncharacterized membrane protein